MKSYKIKELTLIGGKPINIENDTRDVIVSLYNDDLEYVFEVTTPQALVSDMEKKKQKFLEPLYPLIIVRELTPSVIKEALEAFLMEEEDGFWFKLYYSVPHLTIEDLDLIIDRKKKEIQVEKEED